MSTEFLKSLTNRLHVDHFFLRYRKSDPSVGRFLVTEESIKENELIFCDSAFAFVPTYSYNQTDAISYACQNCGVINCLPFPCYSCARVSYCSTECLANHAWIHRYECVGHQKNLWTKLGIGYLAFRTFITGFKEIIEMLEDIRESSVEDVWSTLMSDRHKEFAYGKILRLNSHIDKVKVDYVLRYALTAQLVTVYLEEYTDLFSNLPEICGKIMTNLDDWKTLVSTILLKHLGQAVSIVYNFKLTSIRSFQLV